MSIPTKLPGLVAAVAVSAVMAVGGAGRVHAAGPHKLAGFAGLASDAYWISLMCGGTKAARAAGSTIEWYAVKASNDAAEANANFEAIKVSNPDGVVYSQFSGYLPPAGWTEGFMAAGKPVVATNALPADKSYRPYLTLYRSAPATEKMEAVADAIIAETAGKGTIAVLGGRAGLGPAFEVRWTPLLDILKKKAPDLAVTDIQRTDFDVNKANEMVSALIVSTPDLKVVYTSSGPEGQGAGAAIAAAGKRGQISVYSFDAVPALQDLLRDGTVKMLIAQPPGLIGEMATKAILAWLDQHPNGGAVQPDTANQDRMIPTMLITKANIDSPEAQGYLYKDTCK